MSNLLQPVTEEKPKHLNRHVSISTVNRRLLSFQNFLPQTPLSLSKQLKTQPFQIQLSH